MTQCHDCGRTVENPRMVRGMAFCDGCWHAHSLDAPSNVAVAASLGWAAAVGKAGLLIGILAFGLSSL